MENDKRIDRGVKLLNELMVDIIGAAIPGFLSLITLFISIVLPTLAICIECRKTPLVIAKEISSGFWWVVLIVSIIVSYCVGHIFYRADIAEVDKKDVTRRVGKFVHKMCKNRYSRDELLKMLKRNVSVLKQNLLNCHEIKGLNVNKLVKACKNILNKDCRIDSPLFLGSLLYLLFPEDFVDENDRAFEKITYDCLTKESKNILIEYEDLFKNNLKSATYRV